jgi:hypothetical protein
MQIGMLLLGLRGLLVELLGGPMNHRGPPMNGTMALTARQGFGLVPLRQSSFFQGQSPFSVSQAIGALGPTLPPHLLASHPHNAKHAMRRSGQTGPKVQGVGISSTDLPTNTVPNLNGSTGSLPANGAGLPLDKPKPSSQPLIRPSERHRLQKPGRLERSAIRHPDRTPHPSLHLTNRRRA